MHVGFRSALIVVSLLLSVGVSVPTVRAQFSEMGSEASLITSPQYPYPNTNVTVELSAYSMNTAGADIRWYEDGTEITTARNERAITVNSGTFGESRTVKATLSLPGSAPLSLTKTITPGDIDIIIEADTYTPAFYKGRPLPSAESYVRAIAIPHLGAGVSPATLSYEWKLGENVLHGGPVKGKQATEFTLPLFDGSVLSVSVYDKAGTLVMKRSTTIQYTEPEVLFYEESPLRGESVRSLGNEFKLIGEETTLRAEPYHLDRTSAQSANRPEWMLSGSPVASQNDDPFTITLRKTGGAGSAPIDFILTNTKKLFQNVRGSFMIYFD